VLRDHMTDLLDVLGVLLVAAGVGLQVYGWVLVAVSPRGFDQVAAGAGLAAAGGAALAGSWLADRLDRPRRPGEGRPR
jgi:hypothetical protein